MKLTVLDALPPDHVSTFVIALTFMSGDADAYEDREIECTHDQAIPILTFLRAVSDTHDSGGWDDRTRLGGKWYELPCAWVVEGCPEDVLPDRPKGWPYTALVEWPGDSTVDHQNPAALRGYTVTWHDASGVAHAVKVDA